jgi:sodium/potassium-transporting ATPase subunit alpha
LIKSCKTIIADDGSESDLDESSISRLNAIQNEWCLLGQRVLLICKKKMKISNLTKAKGTSPSDFENYLKDTNDLCVLGMVGIIDKPREGIENVIRSCRQAGVRIFMVTGDFYVTAAAIASQIGIFSSSNEYDTIDKLMEIKSSTKVDDDDEDDVIDDDENGKSKPFYKKFLGFLPCFGKKVISPFTPNPKYRSLLLTGSDLEQLEDTSYWRIITKYEEIVFARTTPTQKLKVVEEFKKRRNIVAVTGDGVNDSPALKAANIGIAMGGGSEVAMEAAQVVLLDNSFNSMMIAIENGRLVFENLRKVVLYLLPAGSFSEAVPIILNIYLGVPMPLSAFQMIVICVLTDLGPSLAMMLEKSEGDILLKPPRVVGRDHLVDKKLLLYAYFFLGVFESFFSILMYFLFMGVYGGLGPNQVFLAYDKWDTKCVLSSGSLNSTMDSLSNFTIAAANNCYFGHSGESLQNLQNVGQTVTFATLVIVQTFGNVFITRTHKLSLFQSLPVLKEHRNLWIFLGQFSSIAFMIFVIYVPFCNTVFKTAPIPVMFYFIPLGFCVIFIGLDELRKLLYRHNVKPFSTTAW